MQANRIEPPLEDTRVLALVKDEERYIFVYTDSTRRDLLRCLSRWAADKELSLTWNDAFHLRQHLDGREKQEGELTC